MSIQAILEHIVESYRIDNAPDEDVSSAFELFVSSLLLSDYELQSDSLEIGIVDGHADGQIDAIYTIVDGSAVDEIDEIDLHKTRRNVEITVYIIQSKFKNSFEENVLAKIRSSILDLFDVQKSISDLRNVYNDHLLSRIDIFRRVYLGAQGKNPTLKFKILYATKGDDANLSARILSDKDAIEEYLKAQFFNSTAQCLFLGGRVLIDLANRPPFETKNLKFIEAPATDGSGSGWVGLVKLADYVAFLQDAQGEIHSSMFDANVRDFEGNSPVNEQISATLMNSVSNIEFWWLNNGITILCDEVRPHTNKNFDVDRPLIVNGLQTSNVIWRHYRVHSMENEKRHVLVRLLKSTDENTRDAIINATNSQTSIASVQLRATDRFQRDIELFFRSKGRYYERRKNMYRNIGIKKESIFTLPELGQALIAVKLGRPNDARARPSTILNNPNLFDSVFDQNISFDAFFYVAFVCRDIRLGRVDKPDPTPDRCQLDEAEEAGGELVIAGRHAA